MVVKDVRPNRTIRVNLRRARVDLPVTEEEAYSYSTRDERLAARLVTVSPNIVRLFNETVCCSRYTLAHIQNYIIYIRP